MKMKREKNLNCSTGFPETGKIQLSYQLGRGYWDFGDLSPERVRVVFDLPKHTVYRTVLYLVKILIFMYFTVRVLYGIGLCSPGVAANAAAAVAPAAHSPRLPTPAFLYSSCSSRPPCRVSHLCS